MSIFLGEKFNFNLARIYMKVLGYILAIIILLGGVSHFLMPEMFMPFIPEFLPAELVNYVSGLVEIIVGFCYFIPSYRNLSSLAIFVLMIVFLPLHVIDVFIENPAIGSKTAAYIRLPIQFLLIYLAWKVFKFNKK
jgi:uncharacterized membrane protein